MTTPILTGVQFVAVALALASGGPAKADVTMFIPTTLTDTPGGTVTIPIDITNTTGSAITIADFQFAINYNFSPNSNFTYTGSSAGAADPGFALGPNSSNPNILIDAPFSLSGNGVTLAAGATGNFYNFTLQAAANMPPGAYVINLLASYTNANGTINTIVENQNGQQIPFTIAPTNGVDPTDGLVTLPSTSVPEPMPMALFGMMAGLAAFRFRRSKSRGPVVPRAATA